VLCLCRTIEPPQRPRSSCADAGAPLDLMPVGTIAPDSPARSEDLTNETKIPCLRTCGFDSHPRYQAPPEVLTPVSTGEGCVAAIRLQERRMWLVPREHSVELTVVNSQARVLIGRSKHPKRVIEEAVQYAESKASVHHRLGSTLLLPTDSGRLQGVGLVHATRP
jgi:hypothetical protein